MQKAFGKKSVIFMFLFPAFLIYTAFVIVSIVWAVSYTHLTEKPRKPADSVFILAQTLF